MQGQSGTSYTEENFLSSQVPASSNVRSFPFGMLPKSCHPVSPKQTNSISSSSDISSNHSRSVTMFQSLLSLHQNRDCSTALEEKPPGASHLRWEFMPLCDQAKPHPGLPRFLRRPTALACPEVP